MMARFYGEERGMIMFRKHACAYVRGIDGAASLRKKLCMSLTLDHVRESIEEHDRHQANRLDSGLANENGSAGEKDYP